VLPTSDVSTTVAHVIAALPREERDLGRMRFAESLTAIVSQQLLPRRDEKGRIAALEVLLGTPSVRAVLRDSAQPADLRNAMASSRKEGMQTFEQHVGELVSANTITAETARLAAHLPAHSPAAAALARRGKRSANG
jgi:twitching motility protein PilT